VLIIETYPATPARTPLPAQEAGVKQVGMERHTRAPEYTILGSVRAHTRRNHARDWLIGRIHTNAFHPGRQASLEVFGLTRAKEIPKLQVFFLIMVLIGRPSRARRRCTLVCFMVGSRLLPGRRGVHTTEAVCLPSSAITETTLTAIRTVCSVA
jgi:hypothetical protein